MTSTSLTTAETVRILSRITTRDEAGTHYTRRYGREVLDELSASGYIVEDKPAHEATGLSYSEEYWSVEVTEDGQDLVDTYPEYHDAAGWPERWIATDREGLAIYGVASTEAEASAFADILRDCDPATLLVVRASVDLANRVNIYGGSLSDTGEWHLADRDGGGRVSTTYAYDNCRDAHGIAARLIAVLS